MLVHGHVITTLFHSPSSQTGYVAQGSILSYKILTFLTNNNFSVRRHFSCETFPLRKTKCRTIKDNLVNINNNRRTDNSPRGTDNNPRDTDINLCLLYTSDAADE